MRSSQFAVVAALGLVAACALPSSEQDTGAPCSFLPAIPVSLGATASAQTPLSIAIGDVDGDGWPDIVAASYDDGAVILLHNNQNLSGDNPFTLTPLSHAFPATSDFHPTWVALEDVDGDQLRDIVVASYGVKSAVAGSAHVAINDHKFSSSAMPYKIADGSNATSLVLAPLQAGGRNDLVIASVNQGGALSLLRNTGMSGNAMFQAPSPPNLDVGAGPRSVIAANLHAPSGSGAALDLAVANHDGGSVSVLLADGTTSDGAPAFTSGQVYDTGTTPLTAMITSQPISLAVADVDHDGYLDLILLNEAEKDVGILRNNGNGTFANVITYPLTDGRTTQTFSSLQSIAAVDFRGTGKYVDLVISDQVSDAVIVLFGTDDQRPGTSSGLFAPPIRIREPATSNPPEKTLMPQAIAIGDLDAPSTSSSESAASPDVVVANIHDHSLSVYLNQCQPPR